jgi:hypothetical protein
MISARTFKHSVVGVLATALLVASLVGLNLSTADAHDATSCGKITKGVGTLFQIRAHDTGCTTAKRIAKKWRKRCVNSDPGCSAKRVVRVGRHYDCYYRNAGTETVKVACIRGMRTVRFHWGV